MDAGPVELLDQLILKHGLGEHRAGLHRLARTCVKIRRTRVAQEELSPLDSRLGGLPHLPEHLDWPLWQGLPLGHIATIRLSEASRHDVSGLLPTTGLLYFWFDLVQQPWGFDPNEAGFFRVDYIADESLPLTVRQPSIDHVPPDADWGFWQDTRREPCRLRFEPGMTLANWEWVREYEPGLRELTDLPEFDRLDRELPTSRSPEHRLLGHPAPRQGPMEVECEVVSRGGRLELIAPEEGTRLARASRDWRLLLQIDTDEDGPGWMWGDCGTLYYWIPMEALSRCDFRRAWMILQCG